MRKYKVEVTETLQKVVRVWADTEGEAIEQVKQQYYEEEIILGIEDFVDLSVEIFPERRNFPAKRTNAK